MTMFVRALRRAYSGERSAALAYVGHAAATADARVARRIRAIARDEVAHRRELRRILAEHGSAPSALQERLRGWLGVVLGRLCYLSGAWLPAIVAARLEREGAAAYLAVADEAARLGRADHARILQHLATAEQRHARYFAALAERAWPSRG